MTHRRLAVLMAIVAMAVLAGACGSGTNTGASEQATTARTSAAGKQAETAAPQTDASPTGTTVDASDPGSGTKPNIVLIVTDDQRWDTLWGMPTVEGALAAHGVTFTNSFVVNPLCCPSRASILTGQYSHSHGVYLNRPPHGGFEDFRDTTTIATVLHDAGYRTALIGKYLNGYGVPAGSSSYVPPGWNEWLSFTQGFGYYDYRLSDNGRVVDYGHSPADYSTRVLAGRAVSFIRDTKSPFFLYFAPYAPHAPAIPPPGLGDAFQHFSWWRPPSFNEKNLRDKPAYIRALGPLTDRQVREALRFRREQLEADLGVDSAVRTILHALASTRRLHDTIIVYTSDNGVAWGETRLLAARKLVPYEEPIRVPLVVRYDRLLHEIPGQDGHLVANIDLAPTFAALAGVSMPRADGRSLLPLLGSPPPHEWRTDLLIEHLAGIPQPKVPSYCAVRSERYLYALYQTGETELYDILRDPHELENLAGHPKLAGVEHALRARLAQLCNPPPPGFTALQRSSAGSS